ncbi:MAG: protein-methionine-sulfoxide reductase catalytic subunit MsrP [Acidobacteriota bacterium]
MSISRFWTSSSAARSRRCARSTLTDSPQTAITPRELFFDRRRLLLAFATLPMACRSEGGREPIVPALERPDVFPARRNEEIQLPQGAFEGLTEREVAGRHTNFYEFLPGRAGDLTRLTTNFEATPWTLEVAGACAEPLSLSLDDLFAFEHEERLYHFRCVERWSMNVPWTGFPLHRVIERCRPLDTARYVRFESALQPSRMPGVDQAPQYPWPYHEALRLDEAVHPLTLLATGVYGEPLPKQHGAPVRLVVPWKYGYKSAKSLVRIELVEEAPTTFWQEAFPHEYGFLSNVNPNIPHPRWDQDKSFVLRDDPVWPTVRDTFPTELFNGYEDEVGHLYPDEPREPQVALQPGQIAR